jgi:hypothetical protein
MLIIAHRALLEGPNSKIENHPNQIKKIIDLGLIAEIDVRCLDDNKWFLGHDRPEYHVNFEWLKTNSKNLVIHAKDVKTLYKLYMANLASKFNKSNQLHYLFHDRDECAITSNGFFWTFPGGTLTSNSIAVMPESCNFCWEGIENSAGICTDYPFKYKEKYS